MSELLFENLKDKKIVVTGGAGFIGSHLVDALVARNAHVTVLDILEPGLLHNLTNSIDRICYQKVDTINRVKVNELLEGVDIVFHLAGNASVPLSIQDPSLDFESNVLGTYSILQALVQKRVKRVFYLSSAAVYGFPKYVPTDEEHPVNPVSPYGATKVAAEIIGLTYSKVFGVDFLVGRLYSPYGPRQRRYAMYDLLNKLHSDPLHLVVLGDGTQIRDYIFVLDAIEAILMIAQHGHKGEIYNIGGNNPVAIRDIIPLLADVSGCEGKVDVSYTGKSWLGDPPAMSADISKLRSLGFEPHETLISGIQKLFNWMSAEVWNTNNQNKKE